MPYISDYYRNELDKIRSLILRESEGQIVGSVPEELAKFYIQECTLTPIEIDSDREASWQHENYVKNIPAHQRESFYRNEGDVDFACERIKVEVPIKPNKDIRTLSGLMSSTHSLSYSEHDFQWGEETISFIVETKGYGFTLDEDRTATEVNSGIQRIREIISWKNTDINKENANLLNQVKILIESRKNELEKNKTKIDTLTQKISIPLKKHIPQGAQKIILDQKPIVKRVKPTPQLPEEYVLDEGKVKDILEILDNQSKSFERTPAALVSLGEENLRDLILANLNSIFEGRATGETFSKKGKTDIYLNIDKGSILVFECKIWGGKKLFLETVDQLRSYLTWRHNYGVIIFFVRIKNFSKVLEEIMTDVQSCPSYRSGIRKVDDTHFMASHGLEDEGKEVKVHYLFYNLYTE
jgi:hypothetical protein